MQSGFAAARFFIFTDNDRQTAAHTPLLPLDDAPLLRSGEPRPGMGRQGPRNADRPGPAVGKGFDLPAFPLRVDHPALFR